MSENNANTKEDRLLVNDTEIKGHFHVDWGRNGTVIFAYIIVLLGYFGIVANIILVMILVNGSLILKWTLQYCFGPLLYIHELSTYRFCYFL